MLALNRSKFIGNRAGDGGLAISSLGVLESINNTLFESNTEFCPPGQYGYNMGEFDAEVSIQYYRYLIFADVFVPPFHLPVDARFVRQW